MTAREIVSVLLDSVLLETTDNEAALMAADAAENKAWKAYQKALKANKQSKETRRLYLAWKRADQAYASMMSETLPAGLLANR